MRRIDIFGSSTIWSVLRHSGPSGAERDGVSAVYVLKGAKSVAAPWRNGE